MDNLVKNTLFTSIVLLQLFWVISNDVGFYQQHSIVIVLLMGAIFSMAMLLSQLTKLESKHKWMKPLVPSLFAFMLLLCWESIIKGYAISPILMPAPSNIFHAFINNMPMLWADFKQTYLKAVLAGYIIRFYRGAMGSEKQSIT